MNKLKQKVERTFKVCSFNAANPKHAKGLAGGGKISSSDKANGGNKFANGSGQSRGGAPKTKEQKRAEAEARNKMSTITKDLRKQLANLEKQMDEDSARIDELLKIMAEPNFYMIAENPTAIITEHAMLKERLPEIEAEWLERSEELAVIQQNC